MTACVGGGPVVTRRSVVDAAASPYAWKGLCPSRKVGVFRTAAIEYPHPPRQTFCRHGVRQNSSSTMVRPIAGLGLRYRTRVAWLCHLRHRSNFTGRTSWSQRAHIVISEWDSHQKDPRIQPRRLRNLRLAQRRAERLWLPYLAPTGVTAPPL
jgi:hypothetical protein